MRDMTRGRAAGTRLSTAIAAAAAVHAVGLALLLLWPAHPRRGPRAQPPVSVGQLQPGHVIDTTLLAGPAMATAAAGETETPAATPSRRPARGGRSAARGERPTTAATPTLGDANAPLAPALGKTATSSLGAAATSGLPVVGAPPAAPGGDAAGGQASKSSAGADALARYAAQVRRRMESHKRYPRRALVSGASGTARVRLAIDPRGNLSSAARLASSAGDDALDAEALRMARAAAPFPAPPGHAPAPLEIVVPVRFAPR